ncbi:helix-turn-helix domain-containing protein [Agrobacterium sp. a22-2]|uniref:helix-turn-helix domain-containing protein n=1 Tax=Agrobacterium sp. a22-2 TaxID=2283840 RepID=UPI001445F715|nr:helix-turn-helix domain-containing protein [Agrobacterium sp. a22-2]NKN38963.1 helix-turn-helix domain-containing protein [Agrobacterium sp. a22-2]
MALRHNSALIPDASDDTLGGRLSAARDAAGIDLKTLANRLGVKHETLHSWEADRSEPRPSRLLNLAGILGVSPMWLMTGNGEGPVENDGQLPVEAMRHQLLRLNELHQETGRLMMSLAKQIDRFETERGNEAWIGPGLTITPPARPL